MKKYMNLNMLTSFVLIVVGILWLRLAMNMGGAGIGDSSIWGTGATVPKFLLSVFVVLNIIIFITEIIKSGKKEQEATGSEKNTKIPVALIMMVLLLVYSIVMPIVGYIISTIVLMFITMLMFGERNKILLVAIPVGFTVFLYVVFRYALLINLP